VFNSINSLALSWNLWPIYLLSNLQLNFHFLLKKPFRFEIRVSELVANRPLTFHYLLKKLFRPETRVSETRQGAKYWPVFFLVLDDSLRSWKLPTTGVGISRNCSTPLPFGFVSATLTWVTLSVRTRKKNPGNRLSARPSVCPSCHTSLTRDRNAHACPFCQNRNFRPLPH